MTPRQLAAVAMLPFAMMATLAATVEPPPRQAPIGLTGAGPYFRLTLPTAVYAHAAFDDLRDLRVRNAAGQAVPFAWLGPDTDAAVATLTTQSLALFAVPATPIDPRQPTEAALGIRLQPDGSLGLTAARAPPAESASPRQWLMDASKVPGDMIQLKFALAADAQGIFPFALDASDDLRQWQPLVVDDPLVRLNEAGRSIERLSVELEPIRARFLRLRWSDPARAPALTGVTVDSTRSEAASAPALEWSAEVPAAACGVDYCDYPAPRGLPVERLRIALSQRNTLAPVRISTLSTSSSAAPAPPRNAIFILRHGHPGRGAARAGTDARSPTEWPLLETVLYRLDQPGGEIRSPVLALDGAVHRTLRLRTDSPISALGGTPPRLSFGARPRALVFLAQGNPPYVLSWNAPGVAVAADAVRAMALTALMPNWHAGQALAADIASVTLPAVVAPAGAPNETASPPPAPSKKGWLWAALGGGLLLLGAMAWSLLSSLKARTPPGHDDREPV